MIKKDFTLTEVFSPLFDSLGKNAFTLAEILITLGIIGVVAAITMPSLIQQHRKHVVETRLAKFYSVINQAIVRAEVDYGDKIYWDEMQQGFEEDENGKPDLTKPKIEPWFNKYLKPYLNLLKVEYSKGPEGRVVTYFTDGSAALFAFNSVLFFPNAKDYKEEYDKDNEMFNFSREFGGTKMFTFELRPAWGRNLQAYSNNSPREECKQITTGERALCTLLIQRNGWKIPKDYPLKF